jgi:hypothetical protein
MDPTTDDIARVAQAIWEAEGKPEGRDVDHWMRAKQLIQEGRAAELYPDAVRETGTPEARPVQHGFKDVPPDIVPETRQEGAAASHMPGPRNPDPVPPTNPEGYVTIPNVSDAAAMAQSDDPAPPPAASDVPWIRRKGSRRT